MLYDNDDYVKIAVEAMVGITKEMKIRFLKQMFKEIYKQGYEDAQQTIKLALGVDS